MFHIHIKNTMQTQIKKNLYLEIWYKQASNDFEY